MLTHFLAEGHILTTALRASAHKNVVFIGTVLTLVVITGSPLPGLSQLPEGRS